jgi:hypothetical protein
MDHQDLVDYVVLREIEVLWVNQGRRGIKDLQDKREVADYPSLDLLENEDNVDLPDQTDHLVKITFHEVTKSEPSKRVALEHLDLKEKKEISDVMDPPDRWEFRE